MSAVQAIVRRVSSSFPTIRQIIFAAFRVAVKPHQAVGSVVVGALMLGLTSSALAVAPPSTAKAGGWVQLSPTVSPAARGAASVAYNAANGTIVMFGGLDSSANTLNETWTFDGKTWTNLTPATVPANYPVGRSGAQMAYDADTHTVVMFGGEDTNAVSLGDTWLWDGTSWTQSTAAHPPAREDGAMVYDASTKSLVLFGGASGGSALNDTWTFNGTVWTDASPSPASPTNTPSARFNTVAAYDAATGSVVLFGGSSSAGTLNDTWTWNGTTWANASPNPATTTNTPPARSSGMASYDRTAGVVALFGGQTSSPALLNDTWVWNGTVWTNVTPGTVTTANTPSARLVGMMAYDPAAQSTVLFGGYSSVGASSQPNSDTWSYFTGAFAAPATNVGATATFPVYFTIGNGGQVDVPAAGNILTLGVSGQDYTLGTGSTCGGASVTAGTVCSVMVTFAPNVPGQRRGAVTLTSGGNVIATAYVRGTATGSQAVLYPGTASTGSAASAVQGLAVDAGGTIFAATAGGTASVAISGGTGTLTAIGNTGSANGIAIDGAGNLIVSTSANVYLENRGAGGSYTQITLPFTAAGPGVAIDGAGNIYVVDSTNQQILKETPAAGGGYTQTVALALASAPSGVALDGAGNLYTSYGQTVYKYTETDGVFGNPVTVVSGLNQPSQISVDGGGNVYIADQSTVTMASPSGATYTTQTLAMTAASAVTVDGGGNVYYGTATSVTELNVGDQQTIFNFPTTAVGSTSSPQTATLNNIGNAGLVFTVPTTGTNPSVPSGFTISATTCPALTTSSTANAPANTLAAGTNCTLSISFAPVSGQAGNAVTGQVTITDNSLSTGTASMQRVNVGGSAAAAAQPPTIGAVFAPSSVNVNSSSTLTFTLTNPAANSGASTNIAFTDDLPTGLAISTSSAANNGCGGTFTAAAGGTHIALSGGSIATAGGTCTIAVSVTPTAAATSYSTTTSAVSSDQGTSTAGATATLSIPQPTIASISPNSGYTIGGNTVTITGTNLIAGTTVMFGGSAGTNVVVAADGNSLTVTTPAHAAGSVNLVVATPNGSVTSTGGFTYQSGALSPGSLPQGTYGTVYPTQTLSPTVALFPQYSFAVTSGALPPGLVFTSNSATNSATISGTPTAAGNYAFTVTTTDGVGLSYNTNYTIIIKTAALSVVVDSKNFTFGGTYPTLTGTPTGLTNGDTATSVGLAYATTTPTNNMSPAGIYTISATITSTNYALTVTTGTLTINKATPSLMAPTASGITYGQALSASVFSNGKATDPISGATVTGSFAWTDGTVTLAAGSSTYSVTFTPDAASSGNYTSATTMSTVSVAKATPSLTAPTASAINYGQTLASSSLTAGSTSNPYNNTAVTGTFTWSNNTVAPTPVQQTYSVLFTPDAASSANYVTNTISVTLTVNPATLTLVAPSASTINYGQILSTSTFTGGSATNPNNNAPVAGTFSWTNGAQTPPAGNDTFSVTFTPATNPSYYNTATSNANVAVTKALPSITAAPSASTIIYGRALSASTFSGGTVVNPNSGAAVSGTYTWADSTIMPTAGQHTYTVTFTANGADTNNYLTNTVQVTITVQKATPTISRQPSASAIVYGAALSTSTLSGGAASVPGSFAWTTGTTVPNAGTASYPVTFTPTDTNNYNTVQLNVSIFVARATPSITTAPSASAITYGQPLSASMLSGGVGAVPGSFAWTNGATVPPAGSAATYSVTFTPTDTANYNPNTINVALLVSKATPTINTLPTASAIIYGQTLAASTLSGGSASVSGSFAWTNSSIAPNGGTAGYSVTFTPTDTANYNATTATVSVVVNPANQTITFTQPNTPVTFGDAPIALVATASSGLTPTFSVVSGPGSISGTTLTFTGAGSIVIAADQAGNGNYNAAAQVRRTVVVNVQPQTITFTQPTSPIFYAANATVALMASGGASSNAVTFKVLSGPGTVSGNTLTILGAGSIIVAADQTGSANYGAATEVQRTIVVNPAVQTITFNQPTSPIPYGSTQTFTVSATGGASGNPVTYAVVSGPGTISGTTVTITGTGSIVVAADQTGNANYSAATEVQRTVVVAKATATLTGPASQPVAVGATQGASIPVTITGQYSGPSVAPPSGAISYSIVNAAGTSSASGSLTISGGSVVVPVPATLGGGAYSIVLNYAGDANYATSTLTISIVVQQFQPVIVWTQPAAITYGTTLAGVLTATAQDQNGATPKTVSGTYVYTNGSTVVTAATVLPVGSYTLSVTFTPSDASAYKTATGSVTLTVTKAVASVSVQASAVTLLLQNPVTITATASANGSPATGTVTFLDGTATLGTGTLVNGTASFTTSSLATGTHSITAVYAGDSNFTGQTSSAVTIQVADFGFTIASGNTSLTIPRGSTATYNFTLSPSGTATFPAAVNLTLTGLPAGATYTIAPSTVLAGSGATGVTVTINIPAQLSMLRKVEGLAPLTLALLLLPFSGRIRRRAGRLTRLAAVLLLLAGGAVGAATLTGCGGNSGSGSGQQGPQTYNLVITGTSGTLSHSTTVTLTVQ